jgi:hypothetical protein
MASHRHYVALMLAFAAGCATTWQVDSYQAPGSDIAARRTFAWAGGEAGTATQIKQAEVAALDQQMRQVVVTGLVRKGYQEVADAKSAQMLVSYQVAGTRKYQKSDTPRFNAPNPDDVLMTSNPQPPAASELPRERRVTEGSVIVFVDDPATDQVIWRGAISDQTRTASSEQAIRTAADMATAIVETFPAAHASGR